MRRRILGGTGISVSEYALGAMMLGAWGNTGHDDCVRIVHRALDAGINVVDTADVYAAGESEEIVGKALKGRRDDVVLATKFFNPMGPDANHGGNSRRWIMRAVEDSLRRLNTDYLDLYQVHRPDPATDIDETLSALSDLVRSGKVRAIGTSTFPAEHLVEAHWTAERRGHLRFRTEQPPYSMLARGVESAVLPTAQRYGMGVLTWGPLSAGWLSGRALSASSRAGLESQKFDLSVPENARKAEAVGALSEVAAQAGLTLPHLATAFVRAHPAVTSVIIGPRTLDQLDSLLDGADVTLDADVLDRIDAIVPPGTDLNPADSYYQAPALADASLRRR
ncbi:aldo/keto reductase [Streptomyces angustmyceticus]|uniref:Aldo/keto reductase n=1 Tax=Streptomyces angustmyceticus TaxID=285578 RepID=A0A5J4LG62_9ACTN|nr:aldo/keto reductase [Streptomyces angustmyceticus]UAL67707.1 aldo/keto reductase [Streptomyces angustmyceticus]GES31514.1 aldo/keto reductase [Streptomyces angustmyceticus]